MSDEPWDVAVTCGGTGGHVLPALALVDGLVEAGVARSRIGFVGGMSGLETSLVPPTGTPYVGLPVRGLPRDPGMRARARRAGAFGAMGRSVLRARRLLARRRVRVVVGMGGYGSLPCVLAAGRRLPVVLYESNAVPGLAVRVASGRARIVGCAFEATAARFPNGVHAGFLVRRDLAQGAGRRSVQRRSEACGGYGVDPRRFVLAVMGGSQGAARLNEAVLELCARWRNREDLAMIHLTGRSHFEAVERKAAALGGAASALEYVPLAFEEDMRRLYDACDLIVCRSGASTCAELAATATPAVCVPYPHATDNHQLRNAEELARAGAALVLADDDLSAESLALAVEPMFGDSERLEAMSRGAASLWSGNGVEVLASAVVGLLESDGVKGQADQGCTDE